VLKDERPKASVLKDQPRRAAGSASIEVKTVLGAQQAQIRSKRLLVCIHRERLLSEIAEISFVGAAGSGSSYSIFFQCQEKK
jgi:hypothetical protein